jgi:hypothetical protein
MRSSITLTAGVLREEMDGMNATYLTNQAQATH